ncbi:MAG: NAD+ synthase [Acidobacteria bacterium]|nr:NAD+ synthase [Acidobacteriota bacterium]
MKLALGQINPTVGDLAGNADKMIEYARRAKAAGAGLIIFPELALCGYPPRDLIEKPAFLRRNEDELQRLAGAGGELGIDMVCGYAGRAEAETGRAAANYAALLAGGGVRFVQRKMLLPNYDVFDEIRHFAPAESQSVVPFCGRKMALTICEDIWNDKGFWHKRLYRRDPVEELMTQGADFIINISSSPYWVGKPTLRQRMPEALARRHRVPVVLVNQVGGNDGLVFDGSSAVVDAEGTVRARALSFEEDLVFYDTATAEGDMHPWFADENEAVYRALLLGTRDYVRKCGFLKTLVGLSGGIDSSLVACIAVGALGAENVTGVGMPGPYSSPASLEDARALAAALGIRFEVVEITATWRAYLDGLQPVFEGLPADVTEENIQARIRGNILMALSNKFGALVLSTGNKSELAVGYSTLYGDMAGGLAVIADIPKTLVYDLSRIANRPGYCRGAISERVFAKPPSAELRPDQKDTDFLPPYDVLDGILKGYVEDFQSPAEIAESQNLPLELVREICSRVDRNEYKRQQAAPGLKVTSKAFGIGRRFPIAQRFSE